MQNFKTLQQPLMGELAMSRKKEEREKNAIYSGHLRLCQQQRTHSARTNTFMPAAKGSARTPLRPIVSVESSDYIKFSYFIISGFVPL